MKRWAIFNYNEDYPSGGMADFIAAFETETDAVLFKQRQINHAGLIIEDMSIYLDAESPAIPTEDEYQAALQAQAAARQKRQEEIDKNPVAKATQDLTRKLERDLYSPGKE
jgi:hypothetical protein